MCDGGSEGLFAGLQSGQEVLLLVLRERAGHKRVTPVSSLCGGWDESKEAEGLVMLVRGSVCGEGCCGAIVGEIRSQSVCRKLRNVRD